MIYFMFIFNITLFFHHNLIQLNRLKHIILFKIKIIVITNINFNIFMNILITSTIKPFRVTIIMWINIRLINIFIVNVICWMSIIGMNIIIDSVVLLLNRFTIF